MKKTIATLLIGAAILGTVCGCSFNALGEDNDKSTNTDQTTDNKNTASPDDGDSSAEAPEAKGYEVNFSLSEHVKVYIYKTQDYGDDGEETTTSYSRDSDTGELTDSGKGQVNFLIVCDDGYEVIASNIVVSGKYTNIKGEADTGIANLYRITKIASDLTVTITATEKTEIPDDSTTTPNNGGNSGDDDSQSDKSETESSGENNSGENSEVTAPAEKTATELAKELGVDITCDGGTADCFTVEGSTITFNAITAKSTYSISGELNGNIVIDVGDDYTFVLNLQGVNITCDSVNPVTILSGNEVTISAKKGTTNAIYDNRPDVSADDSAYSAAIYSTCDLNFQGNGNLTVVSANNNGIHTKDDLSIKNLTLSVTCVDNALKGNDSVTIISGALTLIATGGDCIKTSNSGTSSKGNQKGSVEISGGTINLYAACDGIDAAYDVNVGGEANLTINTDSYSEYTGEIKQSSKAELYIITSSNSSSYRYAVYFYNDNGDGEWKNATYYGQVQNGYRMNYAYSVERPTSYTNFAVYRFLSSQSENTAESYSAASTGSTINTSCNAYVISVNSKTISGSWATLNSSSQSTYSSKGIKADNSVTVSGGTIVINSTDDCIHVNYGDTLENGEIGAGLITISGGDIALTSKDDAVHADYSLIISGGTINVLSCYEGLEANLIEIQGGTIYVNADDDGVNAAGSYATPCITISGGYLDVTVGTGDVDGIDSNGNYVQSGGIVITRDATTMTGGTASGLDLDGTCTITSGTLICAGAVGQTPSNSSQCWVTFSGSSSSSMGNMGGGRPGGFGGNGGMGGSSSSTTFTAGTYTVTDGDGEILFKFTLGTSYSGLWISSDKFTVGSTYTITNGTTTKTWTQSKTSVTVS